MNKKLMFGAVAALALPLVSCQEEVEGVRTGMVDYTISAGLPTAIGTYASADGGITNVDKEKFDLKYTMQVWDSKMTAPVYTASETVEVGEKADFKVRLAATQYKFVFFAEFVDNESEVSKYYTFKNLDAIQLNDDARLYGDDAVDAYYKCEDIDLSQASVASNVTLKRKFGKIRLLATDEIANGNEIIPTKAVVKYDQATVPSTFNALTGDVATATLENVEFEYAISDTKETFNNKSAYVVGFDYILPVATEPAYSFTVTVYDQNSKQIGYREVSSIPVVENKLTTVYGNFFSNEGDLTVDVEDAFENSEDIEVEEPIAPATGVYNEQTGEIFETLAAAIAAADDNQTLWLANEAFEGINEIAPANLTIIGQENTTVAGVYVNSKNLTLKNLTVNGVSAYGGEKAAVYAGSDANLTLENCIIEAERDVRSIVTSYIFEGRFTMDGCTVSSGKTPYFDVAAADGNIQILNSKFAMGITVDHQAGLTATPAYPIVEGNELYTIALSYYSDPEMQPEYSAAKLNYETKLFVNSLLENNTYAGTNKVKISVMPWASNKYFWVNEAIEFNITNENSGAQFDNLQDAIDYANNGDVIKVAAGSYLFSAPVVLNKPVSIIGAGATTTTLDFSSSLNQLTYYNTGRNQFENSYCFNGGLVVASDNVTVEGFTIKAGEKSSWGAVVVGINDASKLPAYLGEKVVIASENFQQPSNFKLKDCKVESASTLSHGLFIQPYGTRKPVFNTFIENVEINGGNHQFCPVKLEDGNTLLTNLYVHDVNSESIISNQYPGMTKYVNLTVNNAPSTKYIISNYDWQKGYKDVDENGDYGWYWITVEGFSTNLTDYTFATNGELNGTHIE